MKKKLLILGGTKYVGLELLTQLKDFDIYVLSRKKILISDITSILIDRKDKSGLERHILNIQPNIILDMICYDKNDANDIVDILENLLYLEHYIFISTFFIYNYSSTFERFESIDINLIEDNYTKNKYEAEKIIYTNKIFPKTTIIRFPFIFSNDDYSKRFQVLLNNTTTKNIDNLKCSFIRKSDAVSALKTLLNKKPLGFVDIANKNSISLKDIYLILEDIKKERFTFILKNRDVYQIKKDICLKSKYESLFNLPDIQTSFRDEFIKALTLDKTL